MIGFGSLSNAGMACLTLAAESQLNCPSAEWQSSPNRPDPTTSDAQSEISSRAAPSGALQASQVRPGQLEQAEYVDETENESMLKTTERRFREITVEIYDYILKTGTGKSRRL